MLKEYGIVAPQTGVIGRSARPITEVEGGLDIVGDPDEADRRSLAEVAALEASDRFVTPSRQTTELAQALNEENRWSVRQFRWALQEELLESPERIGHILSERELFQKLSELVPIKPNDWSARGLRGVSALKNGQWQYVCAVQCGYMPEFSVMRFDDHGLPVNEKYRGWRTVLLRFVMQGFCTEQEAHRVFGAPADTPASRRYRHQLYLYRNRKE